MFNSKPPLSSLAASVSAWRKAGCALACATTFLTCAFAQESRWGEFVEPEFPFFGHVLDARGMGGEWPENNLTPRGLILDLGHGYWACFDPDLLRVSLIWKERTDGQFLTMEAMAPGSYQADSRKAPGGQNKLPRFLGQPVLASGIHPGWYIGEVPDELTDPRPAPADEEEIGRGPLRPPDYEWLGLHVNGGRQGKSVSIRYRVAGREVREEYSLANQWTKKLHGKSETRMIQQPHIARSLTVGPGTRAIHCLHGWLGAKDRMLSTHFPPSEGRMTRVAHIPVPEKIDDEPKERLDWSQTVETAGKLAEDDAAYVRDTIPIPVPNPWKRNVRLSGIDFFDQGGRAALCTFDGDVWLVDGFRGDLGKVTWKRYASGLHEPMSLQIVDDEIYVFGRTCIWRLNDENGDGEADFYENFCNLIGQTAETREFPNDMVEAGDGGFYVAKPGQLHNSRGLHNGTILKVAPDGKSVGVVARGFRQPFIGYDSKTDLLTASDQQGHWVPTTPIHVIEKGAHYGFLPPMEKEHPQPISQPLVWIPHFVNQSGASQQINHDERFGPLAGELLHLGFNRPELFRVYRNGDQGAVARFMSDFGTGPLKSAVNPADGQLYISGFRIWGTVAKDVSGLYRIRYTGKGEPEIPTEVRSSEKGVLLRFAFPVDPAIAAFLPNYKVDRWNYKRTSGYGSGHYKLDGKPGQESLSVSSVYLSEDNKSIFLGIPDMKPVQTMRVTYRLPKATEIPEVRNVFLTIHEMKSINLAEAGFGEIEVDLTPRESAGQQEMTASIEEGKRLYTAIGCIACHSTDGTQAEKPGPTWKGLYGSRREFTDGSYVRNADEVYLRESILDPDRQTTQGFASDDVKMPSYLGVLQDYQIDSLILYIKSLSNKNK